jgi:hypothetical protein
MKSQEEIIAHNKAQVTAIFDRFEPVTGSDELNKSKDAFYTAEGLTKFKDDLYKGIDEGTVSDEDLEKAQEDLLNLKKEVREIDGKEVEVFVKAD